MPNRYETIAPPLPHSRDAEIAFLGAILLDTVGAPEQIDLLTSSDFFLSPHQIIFRHLKRLRDDGLPTNDAVLLIESLSAAGDLEAAGGAAYVSNLPDGLPKISNAAHYAEIIAKKARLRRAIATSQLNTERLLTANGDADLVLEQVFDSFCPYKESSLGRNNSAIFRTAADLAEESASPAFVVKPYVLAGAITELVAKIKAGKTTFILGFIVREAIKAGPVVYLTEQPPSSFRAALQRAGLLGTKDLIVLPFNAVAGMEWTAVAQTTAKKCRGAKAALLVVDTLSQFCGLAGDSENDSGTAIASMKPLQEAAAAGIAVLSSRHERKSGGEIGDAGRGSSAFGGAADTLLTLRRLEGHGRLTLRRIDCISRFDGLPPEAIFEYVEGRYEYRGIESDISEREAVDLILAKAPEFEEKAKTLDELLEGSEVARTTAQRVIPGLLGERRLSRTGKGKKGNPFRYFLTEKDSAQTAHIYGQKNF